MREKIKNLVTRWMTELWQKGNANAVDDLHEFDFVDNSPGKRSGDNEGFKAGVRDFYQAFPDFYAVIEEMIVDETTHKAAIHWSGVGTHLGEYLGVSPSGKRITFRGIEILNIENDKINERWGEWDGMDLLAQLGLWKG